MKKNNKKGFTLVELVIVVAVMAVLVAVAIPTVKSVVGTAENTVDKTNARTIESQIKLELADQVSKEGSGAALTATEIDTALTAAQLGIDGAFKYDSTAGTVVAIAADATVTGNTNYKIVFDSDAESADALVTVTAGS